MRTNTALAKLQSGEAVVNGWCAIPSAFAAETMAHQGWDTLTIDLQHGLVDYQAAVGMLQAISTTATVPMVRVPWLEPGIVMKALDAGAYGVICPMVNSAEDARRLVAYGKYPPLGQRSVGPIRGLLYGGPDYVDRANEETLLFAMIETAEGLAELEAIAATPGLAGLYVGPSDLAISLGHRPAIDALAPAVQEAAYRVRDAARRHGIVAGMHCGGPDLARRMIDEGFGLVTVSSDARMIAYRSQEILGALRRAAPP